MTACSECSRCGRFVACFAGEGTTCLPFEPLLRPDSCSNYGRRRAVRLIRGREPLNELLTNPTSNDLLIRLRAKYSQERDNYRVIVQSAADLGDIRNSPSVSMGPYLIASEQTQLLTTLSIYGLRGDSREKARLLYMNATALRIWRDMGKQPTEVGSLHRPPHAALLCLGVPFSE